jgi:undecaprenyl-diphosphatase
MIEILILSLVQGITEFLPISSSSHLIIISEYLKFDNQKLEIDIGLHIGSFLAVIFFFKKDIYNFVNNKEFFFKILLSSIPIMFVGYLLIKLDLIDQIRSIKVIAWTTLIFGILLYISDKFSIKNNIKNKFNFKMVIVIGLFQVLSLIPGVSRSGIVVTGARFLQFKRYDAAKISFLLSIPTLGAVSLFGINNLFTSESFKFSYLIIYSIIFSFIFSIITIKYFLRYIKRFSLNIFVIYRIILGTGLLILAYL